MARRLVPILVVLAILPIRPAAGDEHEPTSIEQLIEAEAPTQLKVYSVALASKPLDQRDEAEAMKAALEAQGYSPVFLRLSDSGAWWRVMYGYYDVLAEAHLAARSFNAHGLAEGAQVRYQTYDAAEAEALFAAPHEGEMDSMFRLGEHPMEPFDLADSFSAPLDDRGISLEQAHGIRSGLIAAGPGQAGVARMLLADDAVARGDRKEALELQLEVARGEVDADPATRAHAMWEASSSLHEVKRRLGAYQAYKELESLCATPYDRIQCALERVELIIELADSDLGSFEDARRCARSILNSIPKGSTHQEIFARARIERRISRSYIMEGDYGGSIEYARAFIETFKDDPNEVFDLAAAYAWLGVSICHATKDYGDARAAFMSVIALPVVDGADPLRWGAYHINAAQWLFYLDGMNDDFEGMEFWTEYLLTNYPDSPKSQGVVQMLNRRYLFAGRERRVGNGKTGFSGPEEYR